MASQRAGSSEKGCSAGEGPKVSARARRPFQPLHSPSLGDTHGQIHPRHSAGKILGPRNSPANSFSQTRSSTRPHLSTSRLLSSNHTARIAISSRPLRIQPSHSLHRAAVQSLAALAYSGCQWRTHRSYFPQPCKSPEWHSQCARETLCLSWTNAKAPKFTSSLERAPTKCHSTPLTSLYYCLEILFGARVSDS